LWIKSFLHVLSCNFVDAHPVEDQPLANAPEGTATTEEVVAATNGSYTVSFLAIKATHRFFFTIASSLLKKKFCLSFPDGGRVQHQNVIAATTSGANAEASAVVNG
jgi:hypothetical protein